MEGRTVLIEVPNDLGGRSGDRVELSIPEGSLVKLSLIIYMLPVIALIAGAYIGNVWARQGNFSDSSLASFIGGMIFLAITFLAIQFMDRKGYIKSQYSIRMTRIISGGSDSPESDDNK